MPNKQTLAQILRRGGPNPFKIANAMEKRGQIHGKAARERVIQGITKRYTRKSR